MNSLDSLRSASAESEAEVSSKRKGMNGAPSRRVVNGATASRDFSSRISLDEKTFSDVGTRVEDHVNIPPCPAEFSDFIENTSLERLVFWKLEKLIENLPVDAVNDARLDVLDKVVTNVEKPLFALVLRKTSGNLSTAARFLGCNRNTLHRKLKEFNILPKDLRKLLRRGRVQRLVEAAE